MDDKQFDAIVVGSGASGGWAAKELTEGGMKVLVLEAGRGIDELEDYSLPAPSDGRMKVRVKGMLSGQHVQIRSFGYNPKTAHFFVNDLENPYRTLRNRPFNWFRGRQLGGRMHVWGRYSLRMSDANFKAASQDGYGADWPISYRDIEPFYDKVEQFHGLRGSHEGIPELPDGCYSEGHPLNSEEQAFKTAVESTFTGRRVISARILGHSESRETPTIRAARLTGNLTLKPHAVVERVLLDKRGEKVTGVAVINALTGEKNEYRAPVVMLCASAVESVRLLLNSATRHHPEGPGNHSGLLGRYMMDHIMIVMSGAYGDEDGPMYHPPAGSDPYDFGLDHGFYVPRFQNVRERDRSFLRGYSVQGAIARSNRQWHMMSQGEILPQANNRVTLDYRRTDRWGIPVAKMDFQFGPNEKAMIEHAFQSMRDMAEAAGLNCETVPRGNPLEKILFALWKRKLQSPTGASLPGTAAHESGGARMGFDSTRSVLDPDNQVWGVENLFVTDGACFNSVGNQNITLTIMALTAKACRAVLASYGQQGATQSSPARSLYA